MWIRDRWLTDQELPIYVEKILELDEALPSSWPVTGTTGYDFLAHSDGLLVDRGSVVETTRTYERFVGEPVRFRQLRYDAKRQIARTAFTGEISVLASQLHAIAQGARRHRDIYPNRRHRHGRHAVGFGIGSRRFRYRRFRPRDRRQRDDQPVRRRPDRRQAGRDRRLPADRVHRGANGSLGVFGSPAPAGS